MEIAKATYTLNNIAGVTVYDLNDEEVLAGINNETPCLYKIEYDEAGAAFFEIEGNKVLLNECIRV